LVKKSLGMFIFALCFLSLANAQELTVTAKVDRTTIRLNQSLTYKVIVTGSEIRNAPKPVLPDLENKFLITSSASASSFTMVNNQMSSSKTQSFTLKPIRPGKFVIEPAMINFNGKTYKTNSLEIEVSSANVINSATPVPLTQKNQAQTYTLPSNTFASGFWQQENSTEKNLLLLKAQVNKKEIFVGEQTVYTLTFLRAIRLWGDISWEPPSFTGFWAEDMTTSKEPTLQMLDNKKYYTYMVAKKTLVPLKPGNFTIPSARVAYLLNPFDGQQVLLSEPVDITVKPLPEAGKPSDFSGIVGDFALDLEVTENVLSQNTPVSIKIILSGHGNFNTIDQLNFTKNEQLKIYKAKTIDALEQEAGIKKKKIFEYIIIPKAAGKIKVPAFSLNYFSLEHQKYTAVQAKPFFIKVAANEAPYIATALNAQKEKPQTQKIKKEINYLKTKFDLKKTAGYLFDNIFYQILILLNLLIPLYILLPRLVKKKPQAHKIAHRKLRLAQEKEDLSLTTVYNILLEFLASKYGATLKEKTNTGLKETLLKKKMPGKLVEQTLAYLQELNNALYAPAAASKEMKKDLLEKGGELIKKIESATPKTQKWGKVLGILLLSTLALGGEAKNIWAQQAQATDQENLVAAETFYQQNEFAKAAEIYEKLKEKHPYNLDLSYNLGNVYFKLGQFGKALGSYRKVLKYTPRDKETKQNLKILEEKIIDQSFNTLPWPKKILSSVNYFSLNEFLALFLFLLMAGNFSLILYLNKRRENYKTIFYLVCVLGLIFMAFFALRLNDEFGVKKGFLANATKVAVKAGPSENLTTLFFIHRGTELGIVNKIKGWSKIKLNNGFMGWIPSNNLWEI
jgi:tetratricopeptide (TPR) repeat protein